MIRFRHALKLANTKLKSKRVLLFISIVISSILFAALIAAIIIFSAAEKSAVNFVTKANNGVYRVEVNPVIPASIYSYDRPLSIETIRHIKEVEKTYYTQLEARHKAAGVKYDKSTEVSALKPSAYTSPTLPEEQRVDIVIDSPVITYDQQIRVAEYIATAKNKLSDLKILGSKHNATGYYGSEATGAQAIPNMSLLKKGKEELNNTERKAGDMSTYGYAVNAIHNGDYIIQDQSLLGRYLLNDNYDLKGIPVVVTAQEISNLFNEDSTVKDEPKDSKEKLIWLKSIQEKFDGYTYQACYRNSAELQKIQKIQSDYANIQNNKENADFIKPNLQYNLPTDCGEITVKEDTRSATEKKVDTQLIVDQKKLGTYMEPQHKILTFQIVGIVNARPYSQYTANIQSYLQNLLAADTLTFSASVPKQLYEKLPDSMKFIQDTSPYSKQYDALADNGISTHVVDFKSIDDARNFINEETCPSSEANCSKQFTSSPYGSNYLILDEIGKLFSKIMLFSLPIVLGLATIIVWFTMVRVMAENRKETAVYRAMGAKRRDIMSIYITYGMIIALRIALIAIILGVGAAFIVNHIYGQQLTDVATAAFGTITGNMYFSLFDLTSPYLYLVVTSIFIVSLLAILQPLVRSVRRSPIEDMRNE